MEVGRRDRAPKKGGRTVAKKESSQTQAVAGANPAIGTALQDVNNALASVDSLLGQILDPTTRMRMVKVRRSGQQMIPTLIGLAGSRPGLVPPDVNPADLATQLLDYQQLVALSTAVAGFSTKLADTVAERQADLWSTALTIYAIAQQWKGSDAAVSEAVAQMKAALALGTKASQAARRPPRKSKKTSEGSPTAPAGTPAQSTGPATSGTDNGTEVPVYGPNGPEGTAPATNAAKAGS
jgi:hypothetical protein